MAYYFHIFYCHSVVPLNPLPHGSRLQEVCSKLDPSQMSPLLVACLATSLDLVFEPPPHIFEHWPQSAHTPQMQGQGWVSSRCCSCSTSASSCFKCMSSSWDCSSCSVKYLLRALKRPVTFLKSSWCMISWIFCNWTCLVSQPKRTWAGWTIVNNKICYGGGGWD